LESALGVDFDDYSMSNVVKKLGMENTAWTLKQLDNSGSFLYERRVSI